MDKMDKVPDSLYERCRPFARTELALLDPEVVVAAGKMPQRVLQDLSNTRIVAGDLVQPFDDLGLPPSSVAREWLAPLITNHVQHVQINDRRVVTLVAPHPSERAGRRRIFRECALPVCAWYIRHCVNDSHQRSTSRAG